MQATRDLKDRDTELSEGKHRSQDSFSRSRAPERAATSTMLCARRSRFFTSRRQRARQLPRDKEGSRTTPACVCSYLNFRGRCFATRVPLQFSLSHLPQIFHLIQPVYFSSDSICTFLITVTWNGSPPTPVTETQSHFNLHPWDNFLMMVLEAPVSTKNMICLL